VPHPLRKLLLSALDRESLVETARKIHHMSTNVRVTSLAPNIVPGSLPTLARTPAGSRRADTVPTLQRECWILHPDINIWIAPGLLAFDPQKALGGSGVCVRDIELDGMEGGCQAPFQVGTERNYLLTEQRFTGPAFQHNGSFSSLSKATVRAAIRRLFPIMCICYVSPPSLPHIAQLAAINSSSGSLHFMSIFFLPKRLDLAVRFPVLPRDTY
jgi:hypothetical protein